MRIYKAVCSLALLALAGATAAPAVSVDPRSDFDCAVVSEFYYRVAKDKLSKDEQVDFMIVGLWYETIWGQDHPGQDSRTDARFIPLVEALGKNPKAYADTLKACTARANADPIFRQFAQSLRASAAGVH